MSTKAIIKHFLKLFSHTKTYEKKLFFIFPRISEVIDYTPEELTGQNLYTLCHGEDAAKLRKSHLDCKYK